MAVWRVIGILAAARFNLVLDTTVMSVSIAAMVEDPDASV